MRAICIGLLVTMAMPAQAGGAAPESHAWWAFQPLQKPAVPVTPGDNWSTNPIDQFVYARMPEAGVEPAPRATQPVLLRRVYFDLVGMPPSPEEIDAFVNDSSPDPWGVLVDRLLADPRYGEHWARFWLDLVRYAESDGWNKDSYRPNIWRYRDYVVNAFNTDKPYPEFVREQLAGDEMGGGSPERLIATGFLRLGIYEYNQRDARPHWNDIMNEMTDVTGNVFLGLSMSCSRCHDHKFDPIPKTDYFGLRAFFEPIVWHDDIPGATAADCATWRQQQEAWATATADIRAEIDALTAPYIKKKWDTTVDKFPLDIQACFNKPITERTSREQQMAYLVQRQYYEEGTPWDKTLSEDDKVKYEELNDRLAKFDSIKPKPLPEVMSVKDFPGAISPTVLPGGREGDTVKPHFLTALAVETKDAAPVLPDLPDSSGRRTALAEWIGRPDNPLTTRLIVNRIWQQHFGQGIVASSNDFGHLGTLPTNPELLDWLATTFVENGWSFKQLHKLIVMSSVWRQSSNHPNDAECSAKGPADVLLWRAKVRRLTAEQVRDAMLSVSGELDSQIGGPSVTTDKPRRGLYVKRLRNSPDELLHAFDTANGLTSVSERNVTTTPTQALLMFNGNYAVARAKKLAERIQSRERATPEEALTYAFVLAWGRKPTDAELLRAVAFTVDEDGTLIADRVVDFCHVLFNSNEFFLRGLANMFTQYPQPHGPSRRDFLKHAGVGFGSLALRCLIGQDTAYAMGAPLKHHLARAKSVIFLFMEGGPSHLDLLDPKPLLNELAGKPLPASFKEPVTAMGEKGSALLAAPRTWMQHGESGLWASDWIPHTAECLDDIAVIRSCWTNGINHAGGVCQMNTCTNIAGRPSLGAWVDYGLGTENDNLPSFVVLCDNAGRPVNGPRNWGSGFMPASHQGVRISGGDEPIANLNLPKGYSLERQQNELALLNAFNSDHAKSHQQEDELEARIQSYELAFRMQAEAPEAVDLNQEPEHIKQRYGLDEKETESFGRNCLLARRLVERGVRFVQLYSGTGSKWDSHQKIEELHPGLCRSMDKPVAGLLKDLKQRGLLDETLVVWGGEFGRTPMSEKGDGRDHNPTGFTMWMAGGGVKGGQVIGATDELGLYAIEDRMHVKDIHASILWLLGLDNMKLTYDHNGRLERPTINEGAFNPKLIGA